VGDNGSPWKVFLGKRFRVRVGYEFHAVVSTSIYRVQLALVYFLVLYHTFCLKILVIRCAVYDTSEVI